MNHRSRWQSLTPASVPFLALALSAGCASKTSTPAGDSNVDIQASTTATSDVAYIEIIVRQLSDGATVYDSGLQPSSNFQDTRQHLEETVALQGSTDFTFDAKAFDSGQNFLKDGNQVQEATQPPGTSTTVLIVIDLNSGDTNPTSPADITAVTDNIPVLFPPTVTISGGTYTMAYMATDEDQDTDAGPIDSNETLTYFSSILAGNVDLGDNDDPELFTEGQNFTFTILDEQPVKVLSAVVDRLNQLTFTITTIDPVSGSFDVVEFGEGYALFDDNINTPSPRKAHHAKKTGDPTGPTTGPIAVAVLKHGALNIPNGTGYSVEAISRTDDSLVVTPSNEAYWNDAVVASFNRYEEQPDSNDDIVIDFKLRVAFAPPPAATVSDPNPNDPLIVDTIKMAYDNDGHFIFESEAQEAASIALPEIDSVSGNMHSGDTIEVEGSSFTGAYDPDTAADVNQANDQRQIYLQSGSAYAYPVNVMLNDDDDLTFVLPDGMATGAWDVTVCSYGRLCATATGSVQVAPIESSPVAPDNFLVGELLGINDAGTVIGFYVDTDDNDRGAVWTDVNTPPSALPSTDPDSYTFVLPSQVSDGFTDSTGYHYTVVGYESGAGTQAVFWDETMTPTELPAPSGGFGTVATGIERDSDGDGEIVGYGQPEDFSSSFAVAWVVGSSGEYEVHVLAPAPIDPGHPGTTYSNTHGIGAGIIVAGWSFQPSDGSRPQAHAVAWPDYASEPVVLPEDGHFGSVVSGINSSGMAVGTLYDLVGGALVGKAAVWFYDFGWGTWSDPTLLPSPPGSTRTEASYINEQDLNSGLGPSIAGASDSEYLLWTSDGNGGWVVHPIATMAGLNADEFGLNDYDVLVGDDFPPDTGVDFLALWTTGY